ncbi:response regulator receiver protein [Magnetococcus marinus MC-1]|uniref:Response regulator receiver protein n=1 Tax=Magnetococcus marinus (strain ATCC BAA-1437 / JCM 17883 / MC-1) TaxID=156889 RepID=A0L4N3_MAGMM|nr:hemerythrin domain-containing protein [Magnetococcus marinus]ABK42926.1 response regulator receiver protein [Magnetococcus marinus MC-1]
MLLTKLAQELKPLIRPNVSVLYAEDHGETRLIVTEQLFKPLGIAVKACNDGFSAAQAFSTGHYDMLVTDFDMPNMTGSELLKHVRKSNANMPVLLLTSLATLEIVRSIKDNNLFVLPKQEFNRFLDDARGESADEKRLSAKQTLVKFLEASGAIKPSSMGGKNYAPPAKAKLVPSDEAKLKKIGAAGPCEFPLLGISLVDQQHRQLFQLMYALQAQIENRDNRVDLMIMALNNYANKHLADEEALLQRYAYPRLADHQKLHIKLREDLVQRAHAVKQAADDNEKFKRAEELRDFIQEWLVSHIGSEDRKHCDYLLSKGAV